MDCGGRLEETKKGSECRNRGSARSLFESGSVGVGKDRVTGCRTTGCQGFHFKN